MTSGRRRQAQPRALAHRDFAHLWYGQSVSQLGDGVFTVALALETLRLGHSPTSLGLVLTARTAPTVVFVLVGGVLSDRAPRRAVMAISDLVRAAVVLLVSLLIVKHLLTLTTLSLLASAFGLADAAFTPAAASILPELLPVELLTQGNALNSMSAQLAQSLLGPSVGGLIVGLIGLSWSFALDGLSFAVSIATLLTLSPVRQAHEKPERFVEAAGCGIRYIRAHRWIVLNVSCAGLANLFGMAPMGVLLPLLVRDALKGNALGLGLVLGAGGAGGVVASLVVPRLPTPRRRLLLVWLAYGTAGLTTIGEAMAPDIWTAAILNAAIFGLIVYGDVLFTVVLQTAIPKAMLGRAFSALQLLAFGLTPIGMGTAGFVASRLGVRTTMEIAAGISAMVSLVILVPGVDAPDRAIALLADPAKHPTPGDA